MHRKTPFTDGDILFMIRTLMPHRTDQEQLVEAVREDRAFLEAMLNDQRLFQRVATDEEILVKISPRLFFDVLLRRALQDLRELTHTVELRNLQKVAVFDADQVVELLEQADVRDYLAGMLASFVRTESVTIPIRVRRGIWRKVRFSDLDVDSLAQYALALDEAHRFRPYQRIADVCLFLAGMFPEWIESRRLYRRSPLGRTARSIEDYEREGRQFYGLAAEHETARVLNLQETLATLAEQFTLAEKPLAHLARHYLQMRRQSIFDL